ncbi:MAG: GntR family transcriptional regulator [Cellulomonadaceae bacterium]
MDANDSMGDVVYRQLRKRLVTGEIEPGTRIREIQTAEQFGVSRTPVREALRRLESDGFVQRLNRTTIVATALGPDDLGDIGQFRVELDGLAARLACARGQKKQWDEVAALVARLGQAPDSATLSAWHLDVHRALYAIGFGPRMMIFVENHVFPYLELIVNAGPGPDPSPQAAQRQHEKLLRSLSSGDVERAVAAAREHAQSGLRTVRRAPSVIG